MAIDESRRRCRFRNSRNRATIDVYPDLVEINVDSGFEFNPARLSLDDLKYIKKCISK